jgi:anti-anti-sigma factor
MKQVSMCQMDITILPSDAAGQVRVVVAGDRDLATTGRLHAELDAVLAHRPALVEVDLSAVTFFSCAAAHVLCVAHQDAGGQLNVIGAGRPVQRLLRIMQLQPLLPPSAAAR